ncbi:hypothetical protein UY3_10862 [Chelonia mydas]|uniref:Uncharacterized protein n=1 Tax=Chelonia mydas TaxID=8469 RepID=M7B8S8_CHEMY|nr:hypothetical protein UY3_10862 [Chelonia mydas]
MKRKSIGKKMHIQTCTDTSSAGCALVTPDSADGSYEISDSTHSITILDSIEMMGGDEMGGIVILGVGRNLIETQRLTNCSTFRIKCMMVDRVSSAVRGGTDCQNQSSTNGDDKQPFTTII